ncbi:MAG: PEP-CTERM sorting domain-containing protein [Phycisphaerae bacterium]|jgi:hypothetical protein|nr:PEP-CTERM sorting domain-containing protein [Phycisphaerae bacterium]
MSVLQRVLAVSVCILFLGNAALGDWDVGDPLKWSHVQFPDLSPTGMDVKAGNVLDPIPDPNRPIMKKVLADDFECTVPGLVRDIHIWGSWKHDILPENRDPAGSAFPDPGLVAFHLKIWSDIAVGPGGPEYSMPGQILWEMDFMPGSFTFRPEDTQFREDWYDPNTNLWLDDNHLGAFQYNFDIPLADAFMQRGTADNPIVYWVSVDAMPMGYPTPLGEEPEFGWKTTHPQNHWNDDATYSDWIWDDAAGPAGSGGAWVPAGPWLEMRYPLGHEFENLSVDLSMAITPEPTTMVLLGMGAVGLLRRRRK